MRPVRFFKSLTFRITVWYATVFGLCFIIVFGVFYLMMEETVQRWADEELKEQLQEVQDDYRNSNLQAIMASLRQERDEENGSFLARIGNRNGELLLDAVPESLAAVPFRLPSLDSTWAFKSVAAETVRLPGNRSVRVMYTDLSPELVLQIGVVVTRHDLWMREFITKLVKVAGLGIVLGLVGGMLVAYRGLAPLRKMTRSLAEITGENLDSGVALSGRGDEVDHLAEAFNEMLKRIERLVKGMKEVTDAVAHDLRTPLTSIRGTAEIALRSPRTAEEYQRVLFRIVDQLDTLLGLFHSMLDVCEAENEVLNIEREPVSLAQLADDLMDTFGPVAEAKGLVIELELGDTPTIIGDRRRLFQSVSNLLDNAVKYTAAGGRIRLVIGVDSAQSEARIRVEDSGCGIDPDDVPHIFERYYRGNTSQTQPGSGLGLPLVRAIVKAHGGRVTVESQQGQGTRFTISLPIAPSSGYFTAFTA